MFCDEAVSSNIDKAHVLQPSSNIMVHGDFNAHNNEWFHHSHTTDVAGLFCHKFAMAQALTQIVDFPTHIPDHDYHHPYLLALFLCSNPDFCTASSHPPSRRSDHMIGSVDVKFEHSYHTVYSYSKADWDGLDNILGICLGLISLSVMPPMLLRR